MQQLDHYDWSLQVAAVRLRVRLPNRGISSLTNLLIKPTAPIE